MAFATVPVTLAPVNEVNNEPLPTIKLPTMLPVDEINPAVNKLPPAILPVTLSMLPTTLKVNPDVAAKLPLLLNCT